MTILKNDAMLTIFEGPDGGGKTTAATRYADATGAEYVHFGPHNELTSLDELFITAVSRPVREQKRMVFDRCWLSEGPYGVAYRGGRHRVSKPGIKSMLAAARAARAVVVMCLPPWDQVLTSFSKRHAVGGEMLDDAHQLRQVYDIYAGMAKFGFDIRGWNIGIPQVDYDYTKNITATLVERVELVRREYYGL